MWKKVSFPSRSEWVSLISHLQPSPAHLIGISDEQLWKRISSNLKIEDKKEIERFLSFEFKCPIAVSPKLLRGF